MFGMSRIGGYRQWVVYAVIGLIAGVFSGLFGVGGGTVIVPMLLTFLHFNQRAAAGTSLAAIVPTASVGVISYALAGAVEWIPAIILGAGAVVGAQIGTRILPRISQTVLRWIFVGFLLVIIVSLFAVIPSREAVFDLNWITGVGLSVLGLVTGVLSGLIGVGGGVVVVPVLMLLFGTSDLVAKGTSLMMMIPTALSGTFGNLRHRNVFLGPAMVIGFFAAATTFLGTWLATMIDPQTGNFLFAAYLIFVAVQMARKAWMGRKGAH